jgi:lipopolysaccharide transport system permease protein
MRKKLNVKDSPSFSITTVIVPPTGWQLPDFREIWHNKELISYFVRRDLKSIYKQTALGLAWAFIPPIFNMALYSILFGMFAKLPSEGIPYILFLITGQSAWTLFSSSFTSISTSLRSAASQTAKVYFPRLIVSISNLVVSIINSFAVYILLIFSMIWFQVSLEWRILYLPLFLLFAILTAISSGIWITALSVKYRDVAQMTGMLLTTWSYASPVFYSPEMVPDGFLKPLYWLNPMAIVVQGYRWSLLGSTVSFPLTTTFISVGIVIILLITGLIYFHRVEQTVIDII